MKFLLKIWLCLLIPLMGFSPPEKAGDPIELKGAWKLYSVNGEEQPDNVKTIRIFSNTYSMVTVFDLDAKRFIRSSGGPYLFNGKEITLTIDYHTGDSSQVGTNLTGKVKRVKDLVIDVIGEVASGNTISVKGKNAQGKKITSVWERVDDGSTPLAGAWQITRRVGRGGEMRTMKPGPRKTVKILSGTRFQWTAMNTKTKQFMGCGGGTYTFENGKYTENIEFFSRDSSRVGMSLSFDGKVEDDEWNHSGKSSRGMPINEFWKRD